VKSILLALLSATALLAIDGTVHNGTKDKPQGNATVSLFQITQNGPQMLASVKSAANGSFTISLPAGSDPPPGPKLLQAAYGGVTYNRMIPPGTPTSNLQIDVFDSSAKPGPAKVSTHMMLLEPQSGQLAISESFVYVNPGKVTYNDPGHGTLRFYLPAATGGKVDINVLAPNSVPIHKAADKTDQPDVYQLDFPVKPGQSRIDLVYQVPFTAPGAFETKVLFKDPNTKLLAPPGVTLAGTGLTSLGQEPRTKASIYNYDGADVRIDVQGSGALSRGTESNAESPQDQGDQDRSDQGNAQVSELLPQLYGKASPADGFMASLNAVKWILLLVFGILALGFSYVYRRG
jgi:hypothetical protein